MLHGFRDRRWSTPALAAIGVGLGVTAFIGGRISSAGDRVEFEGSPVVAAPDADRGDATSSSTPLASAAEVRPLERAEFSEDRWQGLSSAPRTPENEKKMAAVLEDLATRDPQRAMKLAAAEGNNRLSQSLRGAVLHGWASVLPEQAAAWAARLPEGERQAALEVVFSGAAKVPEQAAKLCTNLCLAEPASAADYGQFLIHGLTELGNYEGAARFAAEATFGNQEAFLNLAYSEWASHEPEQALAAFGKISDEVKRKAAFPGLIVGWIMANPAQAAAYGARMAPGDERVQVISQALPQWAARDPLAASEWMLKNLEPGTDLDAGASSVAVMPNLVSQRPEIAVNWAENVAEPVLRANTMRVIAQQWAQRDGQALKRFVERNPSLAPADRAALLEGASEP